MHINYEEVLNDEQIINMYNEIDIQNTTRMQHGYIHMKNVLEYIKKLTDLLKFNDSEKNKHYIAAILHDVGQVTGRENHGEKASIFAKEYLKNRLPDNQIEEIAEAIKYHSEKDNLEKYSFDTILLSVADKMDVSKARVTQEYKDKDILFNYIEYVDFKINENSFDLIFNTNKPITKEFFFSEEKYTKKFINILNEFARRLNKKLNIFLNDMLIYENM